MNDSEHIDPKTLEMLMDGRLTETEQDQVMAHLAVCDECVTQTDALWAAKPLGTAVGETIDLDPASARRVENRVINRIHRSELSGHVIRLLTQGFMGVAMAFARPLMDRTRPPEEGGEDD